MEKYSEYNGCWLSESPEHVFDNYLCEGIANFLLEKNIKNIYEFGCGSAAYAKYMIEKGIDVDASDGNPHTKEFTKGVAYSLDISKELNFSKKQAVLCLEVGEHIPETFEQTVLDNLVNHASDIIILSWAIEGQGGLGHVNERNNDYIINQMTLRKAYYDEKTSLALREISVIPWFKNTIMVFKKL
jgi:hypothetical protein